MAKMATKGMTKGKRKPPVFCQDLSWNSPASFHWHTAISMYLARHKHEGEAASWAGNSPNVIHKSYKGLVKEADANEYWNILPKTVKSKIVKLPAQAA